jgi:hypothetical protein
MADISNVVGECDLRVSFFYRRGLIDQDAVDRIVDHLRKLFQLDAIFLISREKRSDELKNYSELSFASIQKECRSGHVVLTDERQKIFTCLVEEARSPTSNSETHNEIAVVANEPISLNANFRTRLMDFIRSVALELDSDFAYACDLPSADYRYGRNRAGLSNGLRDVYWVNVFGKPFLHLIGTDKLLTLSSADHVEKLSDSLILVALNEPRGVREQQERLKAEIGRQFFIGRVEPPRGSVSTGGPLSLVRHLWKLGQAASDAEVAREVPHFE